jgi:4-hydroxyproline epimerase
MAQLVARGRLKVGQEFARDIVGSFDGRVEAAAHVGNHDAIVPSISGWACQHGINTIFVDERDPFAHGFSVV